MLARSSPSPPSPPSLSLVQGGAWHAAAVAKLARCIEGLRAGYLEDSQLPHPDPTPTPNPNISRAEQAQEVLKGERQILDEALSWLRAWAS